MRARLIIVLLLMLAIPMLGLGWLGLSTYRNEQTLERHRRDALLLDRLHDIDDRLSDLIAAYEQRLRRVLEEMDTAPAAIRNQVREERLSRQLFRLDAQGALTFPAGDDLSDEERAFIARTRRIFRGGNIFRKPDETRARRTDCDWLVWHFDEGVQLIYWCSAGDGINGVELDPVVLASDLIAALPEGAPSSRKRAAPFRIRLEDVNNEILYQWGEFRPPAKSIPVASLKLSPPLTSFRLAYHAPPVPDGTFGRSAALGLVLGFGALLLSVVLLGVYFVRESSRDARTARDRMTFVNQVSHELKTPLTNLRMYAELLAEYLEEEDEQAHRYVNVIVQESERLSRLIANVLSFARHARGKLTIRKSDAAPDRIIRDTVERFEPVFRQAGIDIDLDLDAEAPRALDGDALAQIVANLLSNVEKYAATGKWVRIESGLDADRLIVTVEDAGEGIPAGREEAIFEPFFRLSNRLTDRAAGTGIGLSISRELARRHGGELTVSRGSRGAAFRIVLLTEPSTSKGDTV